MSRVTLHRIERGEPSVSMGAYLGALAALGLDLAPIAPEDRETPGPRTSDGGIRVGDSPQLQALAWQLDRDSHLTPEEALDLYKRNWRHVDREAMPPHERELLNRLAQTVGGGRLLVRA